MPNVFLAPGPFGAGGQFLSTTGAPLNGGRIATYAAGTTTPLGTWTTSAGTIANANPIILGSDGRPTQEIWLTAASGYKFELVDSVSNSIATYDNLSGVNDPAAINGIGVTGATISGALTMNLAPINEAQGANIPVAAAINLTTATGNYLSLTGTGTVTAIQLSQGAYRELVVNTVSTAFVNSNTLALLGGASFTPAVGDILGFRGEAAPVVRQVLYQSASGFPIKGVNALIKPTTFDLASASGTITITGVGFKSSLVQMTMGVGSQTSVWSVGQATALAEYALIGSNAVVAGTAVIISIGLGKAIVSPTDFQTLAIANGGSLDPDGCTLKNTKSGTPTGTVNLEFTFMR